MGAADRQDAGGFGCGGGRPVSVRFEFRGTLGRAFLDFATARARQLELTGRIEGGGHRVVVLVQGPEALVGAFEMACCIGPDRCSVEDWTVETVVPDRSLTGFDRS